MKKFLAFIITAAFANPLTALADTFVEGSFEYSIQNGAAAITAYNGDEEEVTVPNMIAGAPVSIIESGAFADTKNVKKIFLPDTIIYTADDSFADGIEVIYSAEPPEHTAADDPISPSVSEEKTENEDSGNESMAFGGAEGSDIEIISESSPLLETELIPVQKETTAAEDPIITTASEDHPAEIPPPAAEEKTEPSKTENKPENKGITAAVISGAALTAAVIAAVIFKIRRK